MWSFKRIICRISVDHFHWSEFKHNLQAHSAFLSLHSCSTLTTHTLSTYKMCMQVCSKSLILSFISTAWRVVSCIANQSCTRAFPDSFYMKVTYSATIPACSGSDQASAVGCKGVVKAPWFLFLLDSTIPGGLIMFKLKAAAQATLSVWCYLLALNTMFSHSARGLSP